MSLPAARFARRAGRAVASLVSRPLTVPPLPMLYVLPIWMGPSASDATCAAGTVAVQVAPPEAGALMVLPAESMRVTVLALAPGWDTPLTTRSVAWLLISDLLTLLASLGM